jgi:hypothetical protein
MSQFLRVANTGVRVLLVVYRQTVNLFPCGKHRWFNSIHTHQIMGL